MEFHNCVICSDSCDIKPGGSKTFHNNCSENEACLLRLLNVRVDSENSKSILSNFVTETFQSSREDPVKLSLNISNSELSYGTYCVNCDKRNREIFQLFAKIDLLCKSLDEIKATVKNDFINCNDNLGDTRNFQDVGLDKNTQQERNQFLQYHIAKSFNLIDNNLDTQAGYEVDEEWDDPPTVPEILYSDSDSESNKAKVVNTSHLHRLKKQHGIKEFKILLKRLSAADILRYNKSNRRTSNRQLFRCIFADCPIITVFKTERERDLHVNQKHTGVLDVSENSVCSRPFQLQNLTLGSKLRCLFADCESGLYFTTEQERHLHVKISHGVDDVQSLTTSLPDATTIPKSCSTPGKKSKKKKKKKSLEKLKCIFEDCTDQQCFRTEAERDLHVSRVHMIQIGPNETPNLTPQETGETTIIYTQASLQCSISGCKNRRYFVSEEDLQVHIKKAHEGEGYPFVCDFENCGRRFRQSKEHELHVNAVHFGKYPHICQYCGRGFISLGAVNVHLPSHTNERNYKCSTGDCTESFKTSSGLLYHVRKVHTGERPYHCLQCDKKFISSCKLTNHVKCVHNRHEKNIVCELCGKRFPIRNYLYMHMRTHRKRNELPDKSNDESTSKNYRTTTGDRGSYVVGGTSQSLNTGHPSNINNSINNANQTQDMMNNSMNLDDRHEQYIANYNLGTNTCSTVSIEENSASEKPTPTLPVDLSHFHQHINTPGFSSLSVPRILPNFMNTPNSHPSSREEGMKIGPDNHGFTHVMSTFNNNPDVLNTNRSENPAIFHQYLQIMNSFDNKY